jgi:uncharacterized protein YkwD
MALRPLKVTAAAAALSCALLAAPAAASAMACDYVDARPGSASQGQLESATVCLVNNARGRNGLSRLRANDRLSAAAAAHSGDMVRKRYFGHTSRTGRDVVDRLTNFGYIPGATSWTVGENIAWGSGGRSTPRSIVSAWMDSAGHRRNILSPRFREIGIGVAFDTPSGSYSTGATYTNTFGARSGPRQSRAARRTTRRRSTMRLKVRAGTPAGYSRVATFRQAG